MSTTSSVPDIVNKAAIAIKTGFDTYVPLNEMFFNNVPRERFSEKFTLTSSDGDIPEAAEDGVFPEAQILEAGSITLNQVTYKKKYTESQLLKNYDTEGKIIREMMKVGRKGRIKEDRLCANVFNNGFATGVTWDGDFIFSATHNIGTTGNTQSNLVTGALSDTTLNTALTLGMTLKDHDGLEDPISFKYLLVPPALEKKAKELVYSSLNPESANNNKNTYQNLGIQVVVWPMLTSTTAWFLVGEKMFNSLTKVIGDPFDVQVRPGIYTETNMDEVRLQFSMVAGATDYRGIVGNLGT